MDEEVSLEYADEAKRLVGLMKVHPYGSSLRNFWRLFTEKGKGAGEAIFEGGFKFSVSEEGKNLTAHLQQNGERLGINRGEIFEWSGRVGNAKEKGKMEFHTLAPRLEYHQNDLNNFCFISLASKFTALGEHVAERNTAFQN